MGEPPCMDITYLGAELVSRMRDVTSKPVVSVDVVDVDGRRGRAVRGHLENGHDGATRLGDDKRSETPRSGHMMGATHTENCSRLRRPLRIGRRREFLTVIRGRIWSGGIR
jgi:hypothetical protein